MLLLFRQLLQTPVKRRGVCEFVEETPQLELFAQAGEPDRSITLSENLSTQKAGDNPTLKGYLVLSDLRLGIANGIELGRSLLQIAPGLRIVIYTQDPSWTLTAEIFRQEYTRGDSRRSEGKRSKKQQGLHGYALFSKSLSSSSLILRILPNASMIGKAKFFIEGFCPASTLNLCCQWLRSERIRKACCFG